MSRPGLQGQVEGLLAEMNDLGGYPLSLVCTPQGLVVGSNGHLDEEENTAAFTSLFEDVVRRARRDLRMASVDEVTLLDPAGGRTIIRPLIIDGSPAMFLVVRAPTKATWRRNTNKLSRQLVQILAPLVRGITEEVA